MPWNVLFPPNNQKMTDAIKSDHNRALETKCKKFSLIFGKVAAQSWENLCHLHRIGTKTAGFNDLSLKNRIPREKTTFMQKGSSYKQTLTVQLGALSPNSTPNKAYHLSSWNEKDMMFQWSMETKIAIPLRAGFKITPKSMIHAPDEMADGFPWGSSPRPGWRLQWASGLSVVLLGRFRCSDT